MNKKMGSIIGVGSASVLMVFVVVSLISLGVLTFSSAKADQRLSEKTIQHTVEYYNAYNLANEKLSQIDTILTQNYTQQNTYKTEMFDLLPQWLKVEEDNTKTLLIYTQEINEYQYIEIELTLNYPTNSTDSFYTVSKFKTVTGENWQGNNHLPVYTQ